MEQYETVQRLGLGACGAVYLIRHIHTKRVFALKKIEIDDRRKTRTKQAILKEASILSGLKHPHIVAFHSSFIHEDGQHVCIMQDYCDGGTLSDKIQEAASEDKPLPEKQIMQWFIQILMAVQYIHSRKVLHRDLKTENVFLTKNNVVKIGDFGISKTLDGTMDVAKTVVGTPSYLSPELCQDIPYNSKSDIWALGCILYELCSLHPPFDGNSLINLIFKIVKADHQPIPAIYSEDVHNIVNKMLTKTPEDRPSCSAMLNVPFVRDHLSSFIAQTETLRKQRSNNSSHSDSKESPHAHASPASPRTSRRRAGEATPRVKCSPLAKELTPPQQSELKAESSKPVNECDEASMGRNQAEEGDNISEYSDDFDESSDSEIEEDIGGDKAVGGSGATSEDDTQYADDFEDYDSAEELEEVLLQAREAQGLAPNDDYFEDHHHHDDDDGGDDGDDDEMAQTLTENSFIKSHLVHVRERGQPCSSASGHSERESDSTDKKDASWKFHTFPNS